MRGERGLMAAVVLASLALGWPPRGDLVGLDQSWADGLHLAAQLGLRHGTDIVFTYGPLGFLGLPWPFLGWTTAAAIAYTALIKLGIAIAIAAAARRVFALPLAVIVVLGLSRLMAYHQVSGELGVILVVLAAWQVLSANAGHRTDDARPPGGEGPVLPARRWDASTRWFAGTGGYLVAGAFGAVLLLGKLNAGIVGLAAILVVAATIGRPWWRGATLTLGAAAAVSLALWLMTGHQVTDLGSFVGASVETVTGYAAAMARPAPAASLARVFGVIVLAVLTTLGTLAARSWPRRQRTGAAAVWVLFAGSLYLEGFTRDDTGHSTVFFVSAALVAVTVLPRSRQPLAAVVLAGLVAIAVAVAPGDLRFVINPMPSVARLGSDVALVARPWAWNDEAARTREAIASAYGLDQQLRNLVAGRTVHVDPVDAAVALALSGSRWAPLPVFQSYAAYTTALDELNAGVLAGPGAPEVILRRPRDGVSSTGATGPARPVSIDGRLLWWEQPTASLEMLCRYREGVVAGSWQLLNRGATRCGSAAMVATAEADVGQVVQVPTPSSLDRVLIVRVSPLPTNPIASVRDLLVGARPWTAVVDGVRYRLVPGTVDDGLLLAVPASLGWSPGFAFGDVVRSISFEGPTAGRLTLRFEEVTLGNP
jgi:hypothetical protein